MTEHLPIHIQYGFVQFFVLVYIVCLVLWNSIIQGTKNEVEAREAGSLNHN